MSEIKAGDTKTFNVGGQRLIVEPTPYGNLKKILKIIQEAVGNTERPDGTATLSVAILFEKYVDQLVPLLFRKDKHPWLDQPWIDENMTLPLMKEILEAAKAVNGISDFFGRTAPAMAAAPEAEQPAELTPATP